MISPVNALPTTFLDTPEISSLLFFPRRCDASVWIADYRGYGLSPGEPSYGAMLADAERLFEALTDRAARHGRRFRRCFVFGRSIGSAPAIHLAWRFPNLVDALIVDSGFSRVTELVRCFRERRGLPDGALIAPYGFQDNDYKKA